MSGRSRSEILQFNERVKLISSIIANLSTALVAAAFGRWFLSAFDAFVLVWLAIAFVGVSLGVSVLTLLEADDG